MTTGPIGNGPSVSATEIGGSSRKRTIYLSGPMTGLPEHNYPAFHRAASQLRAAGHTVYNPADFKHDGPLDKFPIREAFAEYTRFICLEACTIALLPGWEKSSGARVEHDLAVRIGLDVIHCLEVTPHRGEA